MEVEKGTRVRSSQEQAGLPQQEPATVKDGMVSTPLDIFIPSIRLLHSRHRFAGQTAACYTPSLNPLSGCQTCEHVEHVECIIPHVVALLSFESTHLIIGIDLGVR